VVDPLDGTREFVKGIPEFCASIGYVEDGRPVAGGIYNPATDETFLGAIDSGVTYNGKPARPSPASGVPWTERWFLPAAAKSSAANGNRSKMQHSRFAPWALWPTSLRWFQPAWPTLHSH